MDLTVLHKLSYGLYAVSSFDSANGRHTGCIANSVMQITSEPATIALSLNHDNHTNPCIKEHGTFAVSILSEETDPALIRGLGFRSGRDVSKFEDIAYQEKEGLAIPEGCCGYFVCRVINTMETNSHTVFLGQIIAGEKLTQSAPPMTYAYYHSVIKGKTPKNAPTYSVTKEKEPGDEKWTCQVCGYVYDGAIPFEELPADYTCPVCQAPKSKFEKQ